MKTGTSRIQRIRDIAGAVGSIAANAFLVLATALAAVVLVGAVHLTYEVW